MKTKTFSRLMLIAALMFTALLIGGHNHRSANKPVPQISGIGSTAEAQDVIPYGVITEDDPRWDCTTMGNKLCGVNVAIPPSTPGPYASMFPGVKGDPLVVNSCEAALRFGSELDIDYWC